MTMRIPLLMTLLVTCSHVAVSQDADSLIAVGDERYAAYRTAAAISAFENALEHDPGNPVILIRLARTWNDLAGDLHAGSDGDGARMAARTAVQYAQRLTSDFPEDARSWFYRAASTGTLALLSNGRDRLRTGRRIEEFSLRSIQLDSTFALPHLALGMYYREVAAIGGVRRFLADRLLGGLPEHPERKALAHMAAAERLAPDLPVVVFQRARTLEQFDDIEGAVDAYRRFIRMEPMNSRDFRNLQETRQKLAITDPGRGPVPNAVGQSRVTAYR